MELENSRLNIPDVSQEVLTKDERYELIALIAQQREENNQSSGVEEKNVWDSNDTDVKFFDVINLYD